MGVAKLLRYLEFGRIRLRVREFATDKKIAVDGYVWAHEFTAQSARAVLIDRAIAPVIEAFVWRCKRWLQQGIDILVVFDGLKPPIKGTTTTLRLERRMRNLAVVEGHLDGDGRSCAAEEMWC